jgi:CO/xanthine dehydrogenase FAD-binding subunit
MRPFSYLVPRTLDEAISLRVSHGERAKYVAGGTDVLLPEEPTYWSKSKRANLHRII